MVGLRTSRPIRRDQRSVRFEVDDYEYEDQREEYEDTEKVPQLQEEEEQEAEFDSHQALVDHLELLEQLKRSKILFGRPIDNGSTFKKDEGKVAFKLPQFDIPKKIYKALLRNDVDLLNIPISLERRDFVHKFQTLLWVEEVHQTVELRRYALEAIELVPVGDFYSVEVPGLAEGRPSLMCNDKLWLKDLQVSDTFYEGFIHEVRGANVLIKLNEEFHSRCLDEGKFFDVTFVITRIPFRRSHHGVIQFRQYPQLRLALFPQVESKLSKPLVNVGAQSLNYTRSLNKYQQSAVVHALRAVCRPAPYIIFGPPGTGKTSTLVEVILQAYLWKTDAKILVCANSNTCTDALALRIRKSGVVPAEDMMRVASMRRQEKHTPTEIRDVTFNMSEIEAKDYSETRIIITTCSQSGSFSCFRDRFDYLFIDEAGHATEPDTVLSMSLLKDDGCCVLAGDPHQLGPVCLSSIASESGLGTSLLERLTDRYVYSLQGKRKTYDPRYITQLLVCYRCDPRVLSISNEVFYNNSLRFINDTLQEWLDVLEVDYPLVFHPVKGSEQRDPTNPSWYNSLEAETCVDYVRHLYESGLRPEQLGIISPYKRQIKEIQRLFGEFGLELCKVATMESFQGDEREIIIISTVRSQPDSLDFDKRFQLGFLFNPKRFNVAISRAKWLVITIGDPDILKLDEHWPLYTERAFQINSGAA